VSIRNVKSSACICHELDLYRLTCSTCVCRYYLEDTEAAKRAAAEAREAERRRKQEEAEAAKQARAQAQEAQRQQKAQIAEEKRRKAEEAKAKAQAQRKGAEDKKAAVDRARQAQAAEKAAKPGATISLFGFGQEPDTESSAQKGAAAAAKAPRGVPTIIKWKRRNDGKLLTNFMLGEQDVTLADTIVLCFTPTGGITGLIYGSPNFDDGERIETSPIVGGSVANDSVVRTGSGSRYFLSADESIKAANKNKGVKELQAARPSATITLTRERKEMEARAASKETIRRPTFSIFGGGGDEAAKQAQANRPSKSVPASEKLQKAPRGVPSIVKWRKNFDNTITGFISGSPNFAEGEKITTSPISGGTISSGQVVKTGSGSRYYLV